MKGNERKKYNALTPFDGSIALLTGLIVSLIFSFALSLLIKDNDILNLVYSLLTQLSFLSVAFIYAYRANKRDFFNEKHYASNAIYSLGFTKKLKFPLVVFSVVLPIFSILAFLPVSTLVEYVFARMGYVNPPSYADYRSSPVMLTLCVFALCLLPAFGEESLMRGAVLRGLRGKGSIFALTISSLLFALLHGSPTQFIHQFLIGLIMAYIVLLTDCLWYSVIFHFINNFTVIMYDYIYFQTNASYKIPLWCYFVMFFVGLIGLGLLLFLFTKFAVKGTNFKERLKSEQGEKITFKGFCKVLFDTTEYKYKSYDKQTCYMLYIAIGVLAIVWLSNTVVGWIK